jgi:hypothetical protein
MTGIKSHFLAAILRRAALRQPVSCAEGLALTNSPIEGTMAQVELMEWKNIHLRTESHNDSFGTLGPRYWQKFCLQNKDVISSKKAVRFDSKQNDWRRLETFQDMYDYVYGKLAEVGITEELDDDKWLDRHDNIVNNEADAYGQKTKYFFKHPEKLLFVDEVGENISQKGHGNAGGQKFMVALDMRAQL